MDTGLGIVAPYFHMMPLTLTFVLARSRGYEVSLHDLKKHGVIGGTLFRYPPCTRRGKRLLLNNQRFFSGARETLIIGVSFLNRFWLQDIDQRVNGIWEVPIKAGSLMRLCLSFPLWFDLGRNGTAGCLPAPGRCHGPWTAITSLNPNPGAKKSSLKLNRLAHRTLQASRFQLPPRITRSGPFPVQTGF